MKRGFHIWLPLDITNICTQKDLDFMKWFGSIVMTICNIFGRSCFWIPAFDPHLLKVILDVRVKRSHVCIMRDQLIKAVIGIIFAYFSQSY